MKRCCGHLLIVCITFTSIASAADLVRDGKPVTKILVAEALVEAKEPDRKSKADPDKTALALAVADLNYHLEKMSGLTLPVEVVQEADGSGSAILLGKLATDAGAVPAKSTASKEAFRLIVKDNRILIGGESDAAVALGIYELLKQLDCDWVMPGELGEVIPRKSTVSLESIDLDKAPDFLVRRLWYRGGKTLNTPSDHANFAQWLRRQQGGHWDHPAFDTAGHGWASFIKKHQAEFDKDPTMYALRRAPDGTLKRMGPQLESTHPRVIELFVQDIKQKYERMIAAGEWTKDTAAGFPIGPSDGLNYSESPEAVAAGSGRIDPIVGAPDQTDLLVLMANRILEQVHKEYPNAYVGYYCYSVHSDYPARYHPNPKLVQIFAPISFSRFHGVTDPYSKTQSYYRGVVEQWAKLSREQGNPLLYRGFNWNLAENGLPYTKARVWGEDLPFYKANGFLGLNVESTKAWAVNGPGDYVFMHMAFDTSRDWRQLLHRYCDKAFGAGAAPMEQYLLAIADRQRDARQEAGSYHSYPLMYDKAWVQEQRSRIEQALAAAQLPNEKKRIAAMLNVLDGLGLYLDFVAGSNRLDFPSVRRTYDAMHANWQALYDMDSQLAAKEVPNYFKRYLEQFVTEGTKYSQPPYQIVYAIPDELPTLWDPQAVGHLMRFYEPQMNDAGFIRTRTFSTTWDAQGLGALRNAAVWYRVRFTLPKEASAGQPIGLFIGAVEDEARVWINGQSIGTSGRGFSKPFVFDLTDEIKTDGTENVLAIQVVRNSAANEIGLGGIFRPCFVFSGPRLPSKAPKPLELRRVLPGGELGEIEQ